MQQSVTQLYDKIYNCASEMLKQNGIDFSYTRTNMYSVINKDPHVVYISEFDDMEYSDFVVCIFLRLVNKPFDVRLKKFFDNMKESLKEEDLVKYGILMRLKLYPEVKKIGKQIYGLKTYRSNLQQRSWRYRCIVYKVEWTAIVDYLLWDCMVIPMWRKTPEKLKYRVKKIIRR